MTGLFGETGNDTLSGGVRGRTSSTVALAPT